MPREKSDRGLVLRCGAYNADNGRPMAGPADIIALVRGHDLDVAVVVEAGRYTGQVRRALGKEYRVFTGHGSLSRNDNMVIVRRTLKPAGRQVHDLDTGGWERAPKNRRFGLHHGRHMTSVAVAGVRFGAVHLPPGPHRADGYPLRRRAHRLGLAKLRRIAAQWDRRPGAWVLAGDWNAAADRADMRAWLLNTSSEAGLSNTIDYPVAAGVDLSGVRRVKHGTGDHKHAVLFTITKEK